uniref:Peptidase S1 domain-containing protein n=1 Tax=Anopheles dirus TaxID=7168 RepID=A0A2C9GV94_9DIPT
MMTYRERVSVSGSSLSSLCLLIFSLQSALAIYGGQETEIDEFPWTALIEYQRGDVNSTYLCAGSLISERYIVTAATCVAGIPQNLKIKRVRLGEWDLGSTNDCQNNRCSSAPIDVAIEKIVTHADYSKRSKLHDIALIRLAHDVQYSETVRPIELPKNESLGGSAVATGWGRTEMTSTAQKKLKVEMDIMSLEECAPLYNRFNVELKQTHLCAGGQEAKDTCQGDTGGPLMQKHADTWYLVGIVSFGPSMCGAAGVPGVYTNVAEYVNWIQHNIQNRN